MRLSCHIPELARGYKMNITVLGTGLMGYPMARRLCEAGHTVHVWNRTRAKAEGLAAHGATVHDTATGAVQGAEFVVTMLEHGPVVEELLFVQGVAGAMKPGTVLVDMSSIKPAEARAHAERLGGMGITHLDAPVSGGTLGAEAGTLAIMAGGKLSTFERARPLFSALGRATLVGPSGSGQLAKLANQMIVGITIGAVAEALLLCEKGGADPAKVKEAISGGFADSRILQVHGQRMVERDFAPRGRMTVQLKDMRNAMETAATLGFTAPITALLEQLYAEGVDHGLSDLDQSGLFVELAQRNGMK
jgi:3-hydroxyisobutyrate dehydrogenase-like beta-hydroxyacid dehydrogenase